MSKVTTGTDFERIEEDQRWRFASIAAGQMKDILNNGLSFNDQFNGQVLTASFTAANTDTLIEHSLNRQVTGYVVLGLSANMVIYNGSNFATSGAQQASLRSSAIGSATLLLF